MIASPRRLPLPLWARWEKNLFVHFRVPARTLAAELPAGVVPDLFDGDGWISAVARRARGPAPLPPAAMALGRPHVELLLATPAVRDGEPGLYLLAQAVPSRAAALLGRALFAIPLLVARLRYEEGSDGELRLRAYRSTILGDVALRARPQRLPLAVRRSPLATFLLERYATFAGGRDRRLQIVRFEHPPWSAVEGEVSEWNIPYLARFELPWGGAPDAVYLGAGVSVRYRDLRVE